MKNLNQIICYSLVIVATLLLSIGLVMGSAEVAESHSTHGVRIVESENLFKEIKMGGVATFDISVVNDSNRSIRILGVRGACGLGGCIMGNPRKFPLEIQSGGHARLPVLLLPKTPCEFQMPVRFYTDDPTFCEVEVTVSGRIVDRYSVK